MTVFEEKDIHRTILRQSRLKNITIVDGIRGCGKRTAVSRVFPDLPVIDLSDRTMSDLASNSPDALFCAFPEGALINEAQNVPSFCKWICSKGVSLTQKPHPVRYVIIWNGRAPDEMSDNAAVVSIHMSFPGLCETKQDFGQSLYSASSQNTINGSPCSDIIEAVIRNEIMPGIRHCNESFFRLFLDCCAKNSCRDFSLNNIAHETGISVPTAASWLDSLEKSGIIFSIPPSEFTYSQNIIHRKRICFCDPRVLCNILGIKNEHVLILSPYIDTVVQTLVLTEIRKTRCNLGLETGLSYFRTYTGLEIHAVLRARSTWALRVSESSRPQSKATAQLERYYTLCNKSVKTGIVHTGDSSWFADGINYISWKDLYNLASGLNIYS